MNITKVFFWNRLSFRIIIPTISVFLLLGLFLLFIISRDLSAFIQYSAKDHAYTYNLDITNILNNAYDDLYAQGFSDDPVKTTIRKAETVSKIESYFEKNKLSGSIMDNEEVLYSIISPQVSTENDSNSLINLLLLPEHERLLRTDIAFDPWGWKVNVIHNPSMIILMTGNMRRSIIFIALAIPIVVGILLVLLKSLISNPVRGIIERIRSKSLPAYRGVYEFEFLSNCIAKELSHRKSNEKRQDILNRMLIVSLQTDSIKELLDNCLEIMLSQDFFTIENKGAIFLVKDENPKMLLMQAQRNLAPELGPLCHQVPFGRCLCGRAAATSKAVFVNSIDEQHENRFDGITPHGHYCIPILSAARQVLGVFTLYTEEGSRRDQQVEQMLQSAANVMAGIIERKKAEEEKNKLQAQLQQATKMQAVGTLAGGIAHEFNNLLSVIMGCADMAREDVPKDSFVKSQLDNVMTASYRVKDLVKQILTFSRQTHQQKASLNLYPLVKESLKLIKSSIPSSVDVKENIDATCGNAVVDPTEIQQISMNLCSNAVWALKEKGTIEITLHQVNLSPQHAEDIGVSEGKYIELSFSDNGQGMDSETKLRIFEPFFTQKEVGVGTGLGLSIIYGIMKSYGGTITVESEEGKGTTFYLYFPVTEKQETFEMQEETEEYPQGSERILFVDDEEMYAEMGAELFSRLGYDVDLKIDSNEALKAFNSKPDKYDLVITDQVMPGLSGEELVREIRTTRPDIPIILCTGYSTQMDDDKAKSLGINSFVFKPIVKEDIAKLTRKVLDGS